MTFFVFVKSGRFNFAASDYKGKWVKLGAVLEMGTEEYESSRNGISYLELLFILLYRAMLFHIAALFLLILTV